MTYLKVPNVNNRSLSYITTQRNAKKANNSRKYFSMSLYKYNLTFGLSYIWIGNSTSNSAIWIPRVSTTHGVTSERLRFFSTAEKKYCKIKKKKKPWGLYFSKALFEGLIFGGAYIRRGLSTEGSLRFKIDWASLIVGSKFTVFALFYFVFEDNFPSTSPRGAYIWRGLYMEGLIFGNNFYRMSKL